MPSFELCSLMTDSIVRHWTMNCQRKENNMFTRLEAMFRIYKKINLYNVLYNHLYLEFEENDLGP